MKTGLQRSCHYTGWLPKRLSPWGLRFPLPGMPCPLHPLAATLKPVEKRVKELALKLALPSSRLGFSTLSCMALGKSWNLSGPEFPHQKRKGFVPTAVTAFW